MNTTTELRNVLIAGGTGFIGGAITKSLQSQGFQVKHLSRSTAASGSQIQWNPAERKMPAESMEWADIVINLAGASIAGGWWTEKRKQAILQSRLDATSTLDLAIVEASNKPDLFISASAVGYYGDRPGEVLTESVHAGEQFLSHVCSLWESAADGSREAGVRVVHPRFGVVLDGSGGMLPLMSIPFRFALGGKIGGDQHMAWIDLHDLVRIIDHVVRNESVLGPVNVSAPEPTTNAAFTAALGSALNRPTVLPIPKSIAALAGGQLARELLLPDQNVKPKKLQDSGFDFARPRIQQALDHAFNNRKSG